MSNDHESAQPNHPSSPRSQQRRRRPRSQQHRRRMEEPDLNQSNQRRRVDDRRPRSQQRRQQWEEPDSNQSNQRRRVDDTSATRRVDDRRPRSQQRRRQREEPDSNQSNQRRRLDDTSATEDDNNNSSRSIRQGENLAMPILQLLFLQSLNRQASSPTSQQHHQQRVEPDPNQSNQRRSQRLRRQREEPDSNQRRRMDHTSAADVNNNNTSSSNSRPHDENIARFFLPLLILPILLTRQVEVVEEDALPDNVNETVEEDSLFSDEGLSSNIPDGQNQQRTSTTSRTYVLETLYRPLSATSQQHRRQMEEPDSNQSNQRRRVDEASATGADNNNSSRSSSSRRQDENRARVQPLFLQSLFNRHMEEDALPDNVNDGDETVEAGSLVSDEDLNSNIQDVQNQQEPPPIFVIHGVLTIRELGDFMMMAMEESGMADRGLPKDIISSQLKTRVHTTSADSTEENTEICTICLDGYGDKDKIATLDCKHEYHEDCITQWLVRNNVCPVCKRQGLTVEEGKKEEEVTE